MTIKQGDDVLKLTDIFIPPDFKKQAVKYTRDLIKGHKPLHYDEGSIDRYGRLNSHIKTSNDLWLQEELLKAGLAQVLITPDTEDQYIPPLYQAETYAKDLNLGVWSDLNFQIKNPFNIAPHIGHFKIVQGTVLSHYTSYNNLYLNFGDNWKTDFTIMIPKAVVKTLRPPMITPENWTKAEVEIWAKNLIGKQVTVRGWIEDFNGPMIKLFHPKQLQHN